MERRSSGFGQGYARQSYPYFLEKCDIDCFVYRLHWRKEAMGKIQLVEKFIGIILKIIIANNCGYSCI